MTPHAPQFGTTALIVIGEAANINHVPPSDAPMGEGVGHVSRALAPLHASVFAYLRRV